MKQFKFQSRFLILLLGFLTLGISHAWGVTAGDTFSKITSISDIDDGDEIIFVNQAETYACGTTQNKNNRTPVSITTKSSKYTYASKDNVQVFVVKKNSDGKFGFHTGSGYIYSASSSDNNLKTNTDAATKAPSGTAAWTLSISNGVVSATNVSNTSYYLAFNGTSYFSQYKSGQSKPYIYKKTGGTIVNVESVSLDPTSKTIEALDQFTLTPTVLPENASNKSVTWSSNKESVATVENGVVTGVAEGSAIITVTTVDGGKTATCNVTVTKPEGDKLTRESTGVSDGAKSYSAWSNKTGSQGVAKYAGNSAGSYGSIQLRSSDNSGIVSTTSAGLIKKVKVNWNSNTVSGRYITIYGSNTAYTSSASIIGTNLGTIKMGTNTELTITGDYAYVGVKANDPLYMNSISFVWVQALTFDLNGGEGDTPETITDFPTNLPSTSGFTKTGYTPNGWNTQADGQGTHYADGASFSKPETSAKLYVQWTAKQTDVTLSAPDADISHETTQVTATYDKTMPSATMPQRTGYTFNGYFDAESDGTQYYKADGSSARTWDKEDATFTLHAQWTANKYKINYKDEGNATFTGSTTDLPTEHIYDTPTPLVTTSKTGYKFEGWFKDAACTTPIETIGATDYLSDITIYAKWTAKQTIVTLSAPAATSEGTPQVTATYDAAMPSATMPARTGYKFNGFFDAQTNGTKYYNTDGTSAKNWNKDVSESTLHAQWTAEVYNIFYKEQDGTIYSGNTASLKTTHTYDKQTDLVDGSKTGYTFEGWFTDAACTKKIETLGATDYLDDIILYVKWSEIMPTGITLSPNVTEITNLIYDGSSSEQKTTITATVTPSTAFNTTFEWSVVEGSDVVSVNENGLITAHKAGTAKVRVTSSRDANIYKEISVTVHALPQITWLNMDGTQFGETTKGTSAGKVGSLPANKPTSCDTEKYPYFRGWSATNFGKTTTNPEANFVTKDTEVALDGEYTFYAVCAAGAATGPDEEKTTTLIVGGNGVTEPTDNPYTTVDGAKWNWDANVTWGNSSPGPGFAANSSAWIEVELPITAVAITSFAISEQSTWGKSASVEFTGKDLANKITTFNKDSKSYNGFTAANNKAGTYRITNKGSQGAWIKNVSVKYNVKSLEYTLWATQCCQAPEHELAITTTALTVKMGGTLTLETQGGNGATKVWASQNEAVAKVANGIVTPVGTGKATITVSQEAKTVDNVDFCEQYAEVEVEVIANNEFGISFTAAEGGSAVAKINDAITQKATTGTTVTIVATESSSDYIFDSWTVVSGGVSLASTTANPTTFEMGSADVKITPTFYKKTVDNIAIKTAPSVTSYTTRDHLNVTGLVITANYTKHGSEDIAYAGNEDKFSFSPALDANLTAGNQQDVTVTYDGKSTTFKIDVAQYTTPYYSLVTDASQLVAGKKVVFGTPNANVVMGYWVKDKNNISAISADYNEEHTAIEVDGAAYVIGGDNTTGFTFRDGNDLFIYAAGNNTNNYMKAYEESNLDDNGKWSISISDDEGKAEIICKNSSNNYNKVCYNASSTIFSCYKNAQQEVQIFIEDVKPEYVPVTSIELNETAMNVMQSKSGSLVATVGPDNATQHNVTWSIINDNANGKITVTEAGTVLVDKDAAVGATATVRATTDGTDKDGNHLTAECVITVTELETVDYMLVTTASLLQAGDIIVLGNAEYSALNGAIGTDDYFDKVQATYNSAKKTMSSKYAVEITLGGNAIDGWTFTTYEGNIFADASEDIEVSTTKDPSVWTIAIAADGTATIKAEGEGYAIRYNTTAPRFKRYQQGSGATIQIYSKRDTRYKRTDLVVGNYGTLCVPYAVKAADRSGATFWNIETSNAIGYTNPSSVTIVEEEGDLVAGKPYIFCATETEMAMFFSGDKYEETESVPANGLFGNLTDDDYIINEKENPQPTDEPTRGYFFVLQQKLYECGWNCTVGPNRGWVQAAEIEDKTTPSPAPRRVIGNPNGTPTGINNLNTDGWKNIQGARKYFYNNQIMIVNEGRIFNAQGIEVQ